MIPPGRSWLRTVLRLRPGETSSLEMAGLEMRRETPTGDSDPGVVRTGVGFKILSWPLTVLEGAQDGGGEGLWPDLTDRH